MSEDALREKRAKLVKDLNELVNSIENHVERTVTEEVLKTEISILEKMKDECEKLLQEYRGNTR